jgi:hypothetical protein
VATLNEADATLTSVAASAANLPDEGKSALASIVSGALPAIRSAADALLADSTLATVLKPAIDGVLAKLESLAG